MILDDWMILDDFGIICDLSVHDLTNGYGHVWMILDAVFHFVSRCQNLMSQSHCHTGELLSTSLHLHQIVR